MTDFLIKNCTADDFEFSCPKLWSALKPAFSDAVRHCDSCSRKVYLCKTDADLKFYASVNFCVAIAAPDEDLQRAQAERAATDVAKTEPPAPDTQVRFLGIVRPRDWKPDLNPMIQNDIPEFLKKHLSHDDRNQ